MSNPYSRVKFDRGDIDSAIEAAKRLKSDRDLYVFATYLGYTIDNRPPPGMQPYVIVHSDGTTETIKLGGTVKGEQTGMLGVPGKVHAQKRPYTPRQMEFGSYGKLKQAQEQTTVPEEMKLLPNAMQNLYWWTVAELREECIKKGLISPSKTYNKKELIDLLVPGLGLKPPYARKLGQVWDPVKHIWVDA